MDGERVDRAIFWGIFVVMMVGKLQIGYNVIKPRYRELKRIMDERKEG